jgi:hypothetical protein
LEALFILVRKAARLTLISRNKPENSLKIWNGKKGLLKVFEFTQSFNQGEKDEFQ